MIGHTGLPKISVIIPVYNVEDYIKKCVISLFEQSISSIEYIFIDDCSMDNSINILEDTLKYYPNRFSQVKIIKNHINKGVSFSRQVGIDNALGEFIAFCDPDDWIEKDMYLKMLKVAEYENADIVGCNYVKEYESKGIECIENFLLNKDELIRSIVIGGIVKGFLWNRLIRKRLFIENQIKFQPSLSLWEDMSVIIPLHIMCKKTGYVNECCYHYRKTNKNSIGTLISTEKINSAIRATEYVESFLYKVDRHKDYELPLALMKINSKKLLLLDKNLYDPLKWFTTFQESNKYIFQTKYRFDLKIVMLLAGIKLFFPSKLRIQILSIINTYRK